MGLFRYSVLEECEWRGPADGGMSKYKRIPNVTNFPTRAAEAGALVSRLRVPAGGRARRMRNPRGPEGRLDKLRKTVTALFKYERLELNHNRADEARQYAERLISEAIRHGDCHKSTMETADFWLLEKELVHKLFKVLVPRFENSQMSYTRLFKAPKPYPGHVYDKAVLELRGNPFPSLTTHQGNNRMLIHNILLDAAKYDYRQSKYAEMADKIGKGEVNPVIEEIREANNSVAEK